jgi:hypothetical protein
MRLAFASTLALVAAAGCAIPDAGFIASNDAAPQDLVPDAMDNTEPRLQAMPAGLELRETEPGELTISLNQAPTSLVTVTITPSPNLRVNASAVSFSPEDPAAKKVEVTPVLDDDAENDNGRVELAADGWGSLIVNATITDRSERGLTLSTDTIALTEGDSTDLLVQLKSRPPGDVIVQATVQNGQAVEVRPGSHTFTPQNWNENKVFAVRALADSNDVSEITSFSLSTGVQAETRGVTVNITDDDTQNILVTGGSPRIEEGNTAQFDVTLALPPESPITVTLSEVSDAISLSHTSLVFNADNFNMARRVTITTLSDNNTTAPPPITIELASTTPRLRNTVTVTLTDTDRVTIEADSTGLALTEEGQARNLGISLGRIPTGPVRVAIDVSDINKLAVDRDHVDFTVANWNVPQLVAVRAIADNDLAAENERVLLTAPDLADEDVPVTVTDDDEQEIVTDLDPPHSPPGELTVNEAARGTFRVWLRFRPTAASTSLTVQSSAPANVAVDAATATRTFNRDNWSTPQPVNLDVPTDSDQDHETATITVSGGGAAPREITARVNDTTERGTIAHRGNTFTETVQWQTAQARAFKFTVDRAITVDRVNTSTSASDGRAQIAVFNHDAGNDRPGTRIFQSGNITLRPRTPAPPEENLYSSVAVPDVVLQPGTYWIAIVLDASRPIYTSASTDVLRRCSQAQTFGSPIVFDNSASCLNERVHAMSLSGRF